LNIHTKVFVIYKEFWHIWAHCWKF